MDKLQEEIKEIIINDIKYSAQTEGYIIHGAIKKLELLFLKKLREEKEVGKIIGQINEWIDQCEKRVEAFEQAHMKTSALSSQAMAQAYRNVKQFIEANQIKEIEG